ncbi:hypothetical protein M918_04880 [Clostridium sp. BL8]|nr:hypothetical protein M918_04880 [Clostridium sp. BL8]
MDFYIGFLREGLIYSASKGLKGTNVGLMYKLSVKSGYLYSKRIKKKLI